MTTEKRKKGTSSRRGSMVTVEEVQEFTEDLLKSKKKMQDFLRKISVEKIKA